MTRFQRAALICAAATVLASLVELILRGAWLQPMLGIGLAVLMLAMPYVVLALGRALKQRFREHLWSEEEEQGRHHNSGGISLCLVLFPAAQRRLRR